MTRLSFLGMALGMIDLTDVHILFVLLHQNCWSFFYLLVYDARIVLFFSTIFGGANKEYEFSWMKH
jgi:hypothetical protein